MRRCATCRACVIGKAGARCGHRQGHAWVFKHTRGLDGRGERQRPPVSGNLEACLVPWRARKGDCTVHELLAAHRRGGEQAGGCRSWLPRMQELLDMRTYGDVATLWCRRRGDMLGARTTLGVTPTVSKHSSPVCSLPALQEGRELAVAVAVLGVRAGAVDEGPDRVLRARGVMRRPTHSRRLLLRGSSNTHRGSSSGADK